MSDYKNICLIGFMGVGKTSVGSLLAKKLSLPFFDTDSMVEKEVGKIIPEIFERHGEKFFRQKELVIVNNVLSREGCVIALGGGAFVNPNIQKAARNSLVVCLSSSFETFLQKVEELKSSRPLLKIKSLEEIQKLYNIRVACYTGCDFNINVDNLSTEEVTNKIMSFLKRKEAVAT